MSSVNDSVRSSQQAYIRAIRDRTGKSFSDIARSVGVAPSTIVRFMNDGSASHSLSATTMARLEKEFGASGHQDVRLVPSNSCELVPMVGKIQAGVWQSGDMFSQEGYSEYISITPDDRYPGIKRWAFRVQGDSMDLLYPSGTIVIAISYCDIARPPKTGDKVIAIRQENGLEEATLKEIEIKDDGRVVLWPRSTNPEFSQAIVIPPSGVNPFPDHGCNEEYRISGMVIQSIRRE
ncbi:LexA family protein [Gluconobacter albidus]|nr:XRE family transcriptional regulator [Gluconobacter albidus]